MHRKTAAVCFIFFISINVKGQSFGNCEGSNLGFEVNAPNDSTVYSWNWIWPDTSYVLSDSDSITGSQSNTLQLLNAQPEWSGTTISCNFDLDSDGIIDSTSSSWTIEVFQPVVPATINGNSGPYCLNSSSTALSIVNPASGGSGSFNYTWLSVPVEGEPSNVGSGSVHLPSTALEGSFFYVLESEDQAGCGTTSSNTIPVEVWEDISALEISWSEENNALLSICDSPNPVAEVLTTSIPTGGSNTFSGTWEVDSGSGFVSIEDWNGETPFSVEGIAGNTVSIRVVASDVCGMVESNVVELYVFTPLNTPILSWQSANQVTPLCFGNAPSNLIAEPPVPESGTVSYQWATNAGDGWEDAGINATTFVPGSLEASTQVQVTVTSEEGCGNLTSAAFDIEVWPEIQAASIASSMPNDTTCVNETPSALFTVESSSGADGNFTLQWQSFTNGSWSNLTGETGLDYQPNALETTTAVRQVASSTYGCGSINSNTLTLPVYAPVSPPVIGSDQTVCFASEVDPLQSTPASGGGGDFLYEWENVTEDLDSLGATVLTWSPGSLTNSQTYRLRADNQNGCGTLYSNELNIEVLPPFTPGSLLDPTLALDTLCFGTGTTLVATPASGADGEYTIGWEAGDSSGSWTLLEGATELQLNTSNLTESTSYRVSYSSTFGCGTILANSVIVPVWPELQASVTAFTSGSQTELLCFGFNAPNAEQTAAASGVNGSFNYQWQTAPNVGGPYANAENGNTVFYAGTLTDNLWVRQATTSNVGCGIAFSNSVSIEVLPELTPPSIGANGYQCFGQPAALIEANAAGGADGTFEYLWYLGPSLNEFEPSSEDTALELNLGVITSTQYAFIQSNSSFGCGTQYSDTVEVFVLEPIQPAVVSFNGPNEFCSGLSTSLSAEGYTGGSNQWEFNWQQLTNGIWEDAENGSSSEFDSPSLFLSQSYRLITTDVQGCGDSISNILDVLVNPRPGPLAFAGDLTPCSNSTDNTYSIAPWTPNVSYDWTASENGDITSGESTLQVLVNWNENAGAAPQFLQVNQTFENSGCDTTIVFEILPTSIYAPDPAEVVKKNGLDALVCGDSAECATYQWGWMDYETGAIQIIEGANFQYVLLEPFLPETRLYFVDVIYACDGDIASCPTRSWYTHDPFVGLSEKEAAFQFGPNPSRDWVEIWSDGRPKSIRLMDQFGRTVYHEPPEGGPPHRLNLSSLARGAYFIEVQLGSFVHRKTLLLQ